MRPDFAKGSWNAPSRYVEIGLHKHRKIYIKLGAAPKEADRLELFDREALRTFGDEGRALVAHKEVKEDGWDWSIEVHFIVEKGVVVAAELAVRATSDFRAQVEIVPIHADLTLGKATVKQTAAMPKPTKTYTLPAATYEGPLYRQEDFIPGTCDHSSIGED